MIPPPSGSAEHNGPAYPLPRETCVDTTAPAPTCRSSVDSLQQRIREHNPELDQHSSAFMASVLLLAALEYGQNVDILARRTGYDRGFVARCARRLIDNGVWAGGRTISEWSPHDVASSAFWNDVAVAEGKLCRRINGGGQIEWAAPGHWQKSYDFVDASTDLPVTTVYRDPMAVAPPAQVSELTPSSDLQADSPSEPTPTPEVVAPTPAPLPTPSPNGDNRVFPTEELFQGVLWIR